MDLPEVQRGRCAVVLDVPEVRGPARGCDSAVVADITGSRAVAAVTALPNDHV